MLRDDRLWIDLPTVIAPMVDAGTQRSNEGGGNMSDKEGGNRVERERESREPSISTKHHTEGRIAESISTAHHRDVLRSSSGTEQGKNSQIVEKEGAVSGPEKIDTSADNESRKRIEPA